MKCQIGLGKSFFGKGLMVALVAGATVLAIGQASSAAQILAVDFDGSAGDTGSGAPLHDTQPGFTGVTSSPVTIGPYTVSETTSAPASGYYSRAGVTNNPPAFTEAQLYEDFYYAQNNTGSGNPSATISISGLSPNTPYSVTFYTFDSSSTIGGAHTTSFTGTNNTTGAGNTVTYTPNNGSPPANESYTSTGIYTSTTGTLDILASLTSSNDYLRINGFTVSTTPEPASIGCAGLAGFAALMSRGRRRP